MCNYSVGPLRGAISLTKIEMCPRACELVQAPTSVLRYEDKKLRHTVSRFLNAP